MFISFITFGKIKRNDTLKIMILLKTNEIKK